METVLQDLRYGVRTLMKAPAFTLVTVVTLALGIGANTALFSVIDAVLLKPLPFPGQDRLVTLWESDPAHGGEQQKVSPPTLGDWQARSHAFEGIASWTSTSDFNLITHGSAEKVRASYVSANLFPLLRVAPQLGHGFVAADDQLHGAQVAVISDRLWHVSYGGDPRVLGQVLAIDTFGRRDYTIVGVMPPAYRFPEDADVWLPAGWNGLPREPARRSGHWLTTLGRLAPGVTLEAARAEMNAVQARIARENPDARAGTEVSIVPLLRQMVGARLRTALLILWAAVAGVLLIACVNVASLSVARAASRRREIALRLSLGAGRGRIVRQVLTECLLLAVLGGAAGVLAAAWGLGLLIGISPADIPRLREVAIDGTALAVTLGTALVTGLLTGVAPAWHGAHADVNEALKAGGGTASAGAAIGRTRTVLVVAEVALAMVLLVSAGLMLESFAKLLATDRGFRADEVITANLDYSVSGFGTWVEATRLRPQVSLQQILERLRQLPGVQSAGAAYGFPVLRRENQPPTNTLTISGRPQGPADAMPTAFTTAISPGYLSALGIRVLRGRDFSESDTLDARGVALINETFARRYFPGEDPIGHYLTPGRAARPLDTTDHFGIPVWSEIVGVVSDVKSLTVQPEAAPEIYRPYWQWPMQSPILVVRTTGDPAQLASAIRSVTKQIVPSLPPPEIRLMTERVSESVAQSRFQTELLNLLGAVALLLATVGIYGVLAFGVTQRRRELGIRFALGARRRDVVALVVGQGIRLTILGIAVGTTAAVVLTRALRSQLYEVQPADPATFGAVVVLLLVVALMAAWLPARRATRVDPMVSLRAE